MRAQQVCLSGFELTDSVDAWFGKGVYFFQDGPQLAHNWACAHPDGGEPCVLRVRISLGGCFDLFDAPAKQLFDRACSEFVAVFGLPHAQLLRAPGGHVLESAIFNFLCAQRSDVGEPVRVVRGPFEDGRTPWDGSLARLAPKAKDDESEVRHTIRSHVQIAVRDLSAIQGPPEIYDLEGSQVSNG